MKNEFLKEKVQFNVVSDKKNMVTKKMFSQGAYSLLVYLNQQIIALILHISSFQANCVVIHLKWEHPQL